MYVYWYHMKYIGRHIKLYGHLFFCMDTILICMDAILICMKQNSNFEGRDNIQKESN